MFNKSIIIAQKNYRNSFYDWSLISTTTVVNDVFSGQVLIIGLIEATVFGFC